MIKVILLSLTLLASCSSRKELTSADEMRGQYLYNLRLKKEYTEFLSKKVFPNGATVYAGPALVAFSNGQPVRLAGIKSNEAMNSVYRSNGGAEIEYDDHFLNLTGPETYRMTFDATLKGLEQYETHRFQVNMKLTCKEKLECTYRPREDFVHYQDPYDFSFELLPAEYDYLKTSPLDLKGFSDSDQTAIKSRMIYVGMSQAAAEEAIGKNTHHVHGFYNVRYKEGVVYDFEFKFNHNLHYFNR